MEISDFSFLDENHVEEIYLYIYIILLIISTRIYQDIIVGVIGARISIYIINLAIRERERENCRKTKEHI